MPLARIHVAAMIMLPLLIGCKNESNSGPGPKPQEQPIVQQPAPEPTPDNPEIVSAIEQATGVVTKKSGDNIVLLDLRGLRPDAAGDQSDEFAWVAGLPRLTTIMAAGPGVTLEAVEQLKDHANLTTVTFDNCTQVKDEAVEILASLPKIADVNLIKSDITNKSLETLSKSKTILRIRIARTKVTDEGIAHLENCPQLELLDLLECSQLTNACSQTIGKLTKLRNVKLPAAVDDSGAAELGNLKGLVALGMQYCRVGPEGLAHITELKELKEINLYGATKVNDEVFALLAKLPKLAKLRLRETTVRGENAADLAEIKGLVDLDVSESPVQDALMEQVAKLSKLQNLNLWNTEVTGEGVKMLGGLTELKQLKLENLQDTIDDETLDTIAKLTNLEVLDLRGTGVTDEGMPKLHGLKKLKKLVLASTFVIEKSSIKALKEQIPDVEIDW